VQDRIEALEKENAELRKEIIKRDHIIELLTKRIEDLERRLNMNSSNSSKPPSSDGLKKKTRSRQNSKRKIGGQKGHAGSSRKMLPSEKVDELVKVPLVKPVCACGCQKFISKKFSKRHQVWELPKIKPHITEYLLESARCKSCRKRVSADLPEGVSKTTLGPNAQTWMGLLTGVYRLSRSNAQKFLEEVCGIKRSIGNISATEKSISRNIRPIQKQALDALRRSEVLHMDETGHKRSGVRRQTWVMANKDWSFFSSGSRRNRKVLISLLSKKFAGIVVSDRYAAYNYLSLHQHQYCWAHLYRQIRGLSERTGELGLIAKDIFKWMGCIFDLNRRRHEVSAQYYSHFIDSYRNGIKQMLGDNFLAHPELKSFAHLFWFKEEKVWGFEKNSAIPMTNNRAERDLRPAVIWRKTSFGTSSHRGDRYAERMLTFSSSIRKQGKSLFGTLNYLIASGLSGVKPEIPCPIG
jgi:transposase